MDSIAGTSTSFRIDISNKIESDAALDMGPFLRQEGRQIARPSRTMPGIIEGPSLSAGIATVDWMDSRLPPRTGRSVGLQGRTAWLAWLVRSIRPVR